MTADPKLLLIGCGHLGSAMLRHWAATKSYGEAYIVKPSPLAEDLKALPNIKSFTSADQLPDFRPDVIVIAVRPPSIDSVLPIYAKYTESLFLSIAAGKKIGKLAALLQGDHAILRAMPNIAAEVGASMTFALANAHVTSEQKICAEKLLRAIGDFAWVEKEDWFDVGTALVGCGPAYIYAFGEALAKAGEALGLPPQLAQQLARQTLIGSGAVLQHSPETMETIRQAIGNPGTMTEAGLKQLAAANGLMDLLKKAVQASTDRAKELARLA